ncbi:DNA-binding protein [Aurantiacibacter zhengii]|uniref:DNA-binding protein n=2 Tax=Aurantiacibacter zhengii TaxID=2307003 RepID=A0A418NP31_9SPHN|nr:DNA-binding protein [Aurantiacibacter zhengii]
MEPLALPPKEAFAAIGVGVTKGYELIASGDLQTFKVGRATRVTTESIRAYVARQIELCSKAA